MSYEIIRNNLQCFLHQGYDQDSGSIAKALLGAVQHCDRLKLIAELDNLKIESHVVIQEVLGDHDVELWDYVTPRELLTTLRVLAALSGSRSSS